MRIRRWWSANFLCKPAVCMWLTLCANPHAALPWKVSVTRLSRCSRRGAAPSSAPSQVSDPEVWSWQDIQALEIEAIADTPCFLFLWCGAEEGLEAGRVCMQVRPGKAPPTDA